MLLEVISLTPSVNHEKWTGVLDDEQRMMPAVARVVHTLPTRCGKCPIARGNARVRADDHQPRPSVQRHEQLASKRMAFHQLDLDRSWPCGRNEPTDVDPSAFRGDVDMGELVKPLG